MPTRRHFLGALGVPAAGLAAHTGHLDLAALARCRDRLAELRDTPGTPDEIARNEDFWFEVQRAFAVDRSLINFNNGGVSPAPRVVLDAMAEHVTYSNKAPTYTMWRILEPQRENVRSAVADAWGVDREEIAFTRNASESLQICQLGFDLEPGDEVLTTTQDYPRMLTTFEQRERRDKIKLVKIELPVPCEDDDEVVRRFEAAITPRTKLILVCHMINLTGQVLPVRRVAQLGRRKGIPVVVDGAHSFAHIDFKLSDLDCDYFGTSLHKWLFAPHGTGLLYVRRDKIDGLWPMMAAAEDLDGDIRKFEQIGTHPAAPTLAIAEALAFHLGIGGKRKQARLVHLRDSWAKRLARHDRVRLHTSLKPGFAGGIATVEIEGVDTKALAQHLMKDHRIVVTMIDHAQFKGLRISPSVYTTPAEIDRFATIMERVIHDGLPT